MPAFSLVPGSAARSGLPRLLPTNMFYEESRTEPGGLTMIGRPRLRAYPIGGGDPWETGKAVNAVYQDDAVVGGDLIMLIGNSFYVDGTDEGTVDVTGGGDPPYSMQPSIAGNSVGVVVTALDNADFWDGTTFRDIAFPDGAKVTKVLEQGHRFIFLRAGTHRYYWTEPGANMLDMSGDIDIDALDFASAESEPDTLVDGLVFRDHLVLGGKSSIEMHGVTLNDNAPWAPALAATIAKGVFSTGAMTLWNNTFAWIDQNGVIWQYDGSAGVRVSNTAIERELRGIAVAGLDSFTYDGHEFLRLKTYDAEDYVLDPQTGEWSVWTGADGFIGGRTIYNTGLPYDGDLLFGSSEDGELLRLSSESQPGDLVEDSIEYSGYFGLPLDAGQVTMHSVLFRMETDDSCTVEMRFSRDKGNTWSSWQSVTTGGNVRKKIEFRSLGMFDQPGFLGQWRVLDYASLGPFYLSGIYFNEFVAGRGRS